jgi:biopolymer transport protein ExbB/TolQ
MVSLARAERKASRFVKDHVDVDDLYDQLDALRGYVQKLSSGFGKSAGREWKRARSFASDTAHDAEETMKDNLAASLVLAVGLGIVVGYFLRRGTE